MRVNWGQPVVRCTTDIFHSSYFLIVVYMEPCTSHGQIKGMEEEYG
jgi:hypothetical protein